ncbi:aldo/keto reductase [Candidatus Latescibacterota bacterium]
MKRRAFVAKALAVIAALENMGCSTLGKKIALNRGQVEYSPEILKEKRSRPKGTMPFGKLGTTGIKVSKFTFGSHMTKELIPYEKEREYMIREAHDLGINTFDIYDSSSHQFEPMGRYLEPIKNDVLVSVHATEYSSAYEGNPEALSVDRGIEKMLRVMRRDCIDLARNYCPTPDHPNAQNWKSLFKMKEKGYIRAVGTPVHSPVQIDHMLDVYPIDYVVFPHNFYHNLNYTGDNVQGVPKMVKKLRERGIGVIVMKPFASEWFIPHLLKASNEIDETGEISLPQAMLRYIINSEIDADTTMGGMYSLKEVYENIEAYYIPELTPEEEKHLGKLRKVTKVIADSVLPVQYRFLQEWSPDGSGVQTKTGLT